LWSKLPFVRGGKPEIIEPAELSGDLYITGKSKGNKRVPAVYKISARNAKLISSLRDSRAGMVIDIDVDEKRHRLYLLNEFGKKLFVYDSRTMKQIEELNFNKSKFLSWPYAVETDSKTGVVYVSSFLAGNRLYRIDPATKKVIHRFLPSMGLAVDERRGLIYAARPILSRIDALDASTLKTVASIPAGAAVRNIELSPGGKYLIAGEFIKGKVSIIDLDLRKIVAVMKAGKNPRGLHYNPGEKTLIVSTSEKVVSYDLATLKPDIVNKKIQKQ
jgi:DNA-binding beta-propeller fold protein YncE